MAQGHPLAHARVGDGHHAVAAARVVLPQVPAEGVEVGELPAVQETTQQQSTWGGGGDKRRRKGERINEAESEGVTLMCRFFNSYSAARQYTECSKMLQCLDTSSCY